MSTKTVSYKHYVAGWFDSSIHDFLGALSPDYSSTKYALISCLDSNPSPASMLGKSRELKSIAAKTKVLGTGLLLRTEDVLTADAQSRLFFGFDEIWFFPKDDIEPKPETARIVGPARIDRATLRTLFSWLSLTSCSLALGDGEGLNFILKARGLIGHVIGYSLEQRQSRVTCMVSPSGGGEQRSGSGYGSIDSPVQYPT